MTMPLKTALNAALREKIITPEMKQTIEDSLFTLTFDREDMRMLEMQLNQLVPEALITVESSQI